VTLDAMDRELDSGVRRRRLAGRLAVGSGLAVLAAAVLVLLPAWLRPSVDRERLRIGVVDRGPVEGVIEASGAVVPAFEKVLSSPVEARVDRILVRPGAAISPGDEILALDTSASRLELSRLEDLLAQKESEREELRLDLEAELAGLGSRIESGRLDAEILRYRLEQDRKLFAEGLAAEEALRGAEVAAEKAAIELRQLEESVERTRRTHAARLRGLGLDVDILRAQREAARRELELATTRADRAGVLTWVIPEEGATVARGQVIARIADLDSFRVEATVSDVHAARLAPRLPVRVLLDGETLEGHLASVHPRIENGVVRFDVALAEPDHPRLRNNLRVDVLVVTAFRRDAVRLPQGSFAGGGALAQVFVVEGSRAVRTEVRFGLTGHQHVEIEEGLLPGQEVILSDMSQHLHLEEVQVDG